MVYLVETSCSYIHTVATLSQHIMFLEKPTQKLPSLALVSVYDTAECDSTKQPQCALHCNTCIKYKFSELIF